MSSCVLDSSAVLALLNQEPGATQVATAVDGGAAISAVNLAEVVTKLSEAGMPEAVVRAAVDPLGLHIIALDAERAYQTGLLRQRTRQAGLSLGDRACLALAQHLGLPALTTDRSWARIPLGIAVRLIR